MNRIKVDDRTGSRVRLRVRRLHEHDLAERTLRAARTINGHAWGIETAGSVANCYGYPAATECALALPDGRCVVRLARIAANKCTLSGAASACGLDTLIPLVDGRYAIETRNIAAHHVDRAVESIVESFFIDSTE